MTAKITSGQKKQIVRFASDAIELALEGFEGDKDAAQLVIEKGDEFAHKMREAAISAIAELSVSQDFKGEEVHSGYSYPPEYTGPAPIAEQVDQLASLFSLSVGGTTAFIETLHSRTLPEGAEGWFAVPKVDALAARFFPEVKDPGERYCRAVDLILGKIGESRKFTNYREGQITPDRLRQHARTATMLERIAAEQTGDFLILPAQFGLRHRGKSVRRARALFRKDEFGLGSLAVGSMLLTHPTRLVRWEQLHMDCAGDEFAPGAGGRFVSAPYFGWNDGRVRFRTVFAISPDGHYGSASGFLPQ